MNKKTIPVFLAFLVMGFGDVVGTLVGFAKKTYHLSPSMAGLLPLLGFIMFGLLSVPAGVLQDKIGRKSILLLGLSIALTGMLIPVINISNYGFLMAAIILMGSGMAILQVAGNPIMRDVSDPKKYSRNLTFAQFIKAIGSLSGSILTALVLIKWTAIFPLYAAIILMTIITVSILKIGKSREKSEQASLKSCFALLKKKYILMMVIGIFLYVGAEVGVNSWIATYLNDSFGLDIQKMATLGIGFFFIALMTGRFFGSIILNWMVPSRFFLISSIVSIIGIAGLFSQIQMVAIISIFIIGLGFANIFPLIFSILIDKYPESGNELSGLMVMAIVGGAIIPYLMALVADHWILGSFLIPLVSFFYITILAVRSGKAKNA